MSYLLQRGRGTVGDNCQGEEMSEEREGRPASKYPDHCRSAALSVSLVARYSLRTVVPTVTLIL